MSGLAGLIAGRSIFGRTITDGAAKVIAYAGLVLLLCGTFAGLVAAYNHRVIANHDAKQIQRAAPATDRAADERAKDAITNAKSEQEAHDVIHSVPDAAPAGPSHQLACQRLRKLGRSVPSCR